MSLCTCESDSDENCFKHGSDNKNARRIAELTNLVESLNQDKRMLLAQKLAVENLLLKCQVHLNGSDAADDLWVEINQALTGDEV